LELFNSATSIGIKYFFKINIVTILGFFVIISVVIYAYFMHLEREQNLIKGKTLYTVGEVIHYKSHGKMGLSIGYSFLFNGVKIETTNYPDEPLKNSIYKRYEYDYEKIRKLLIGKKFLVKVSIENPKYSLICLSKPVAEGFQYVEGQTWETIPKEAVESKDIYGNLR
jgi:hypothetical protein